MVQRKFIGIVLASIFAVGVSGLWPQNAEAIIYQWTDDSGKKHFTTDKANIPRKYRVREKIKTTGTPARAPQLEEPSLEGEEAPPGEGGESSKKLSPEEIVAMINEAKGYLEKENKKFEKLASLSITRDNSKYFMMTIKMGLSVRERQAKKFEESRIPVLQPVSSFLMTTLKLDQEETPGQKQKISELKKLQKRIKKEYKTRSKLLKALERDLKEREKEMKK